MSNIMVIIGSTFTQWYNILLKAENQKILYTNISGPDIVYAKKSTSDLRKISMYILRKMFEILLH